MKFSSLYSNARALAGAACLFLCSQAQAASPCPLLTDAEIATAFKDPGVRLEKAYPMGVCKWILSNGDKVRINLERHIDVAEAKLSYTSRSQFYGARYKRLAAKPAVGQRAFFGIGTVADAALSGDTAGTAMLLTMRDSSVVELTYRAREHEDVPDAVAAPIRGLGKRAISRIDKADQSFGKCDWFTDAEIRQLLGQGALIIQRIGPDSCSVWNKVSKGSITIDLQEGQWNDEPDRLGCTVVKLPQLGPYAHVKYACKELENKELLLVFNKNGKHVVLRVKPAVRDPDEGDLGPVIDIGQRAFDRH